MEREILFRGKRADNGEWVEGYYVKYQPIASKAQFVAGIVPDYASSFYLIEIIPLTLGRYTGLTDRNGVRIFEGDVCIFQNVFSSKPHIGVVRYYANAKPISDDGQYSVDLAECNPEDLEVIGNIHDNPELLKGEE